MRARGKNRKREICVCLCFLRTTSEKREHATRPPRIDASLATSKKERSVSVFGSAKLKGREKEGERDEQLGANKDVWREIGKVI